ncbi:MAG: NTP transferase domain-containing protein [Treponema sp.]|nr:NTP transferase domain-containing protein [Treponema sp.]
MTAIALQARLDSSRLAEKALLPLDGKPLIYRVMEALKQIPADERILACPEDSLSVFTPLAEEAGFKIYAGPKEDVLERYCQVIRHFDIKRVIRATGDNPFVFTDAAMAINAEAGALNADYAGYSGIPHGAGVEAINASALLRAGKEAATSYEREHVCPYLYGHGDIFKLHRPLAPLHWQAPDIRLTVDTQEDYSRAKELYAVLKDNPYRSHGSVIIKTYRECFSNFSHRDIEPCSEYAEGAEIK